MAAGILSSQFSTESDPVSAAIRYLTDGDYSHVDLIVTKANIVAFSAFVPNPKTRTLLETWEPEYGLLGARLNGGVAIRKPGYANFTKIAHCTCEVPDVNAGYVFAFSQIGKPYDKTAILNMFLHRARPFSMQMPQWFCDCLNYTIYWAAGKLLLNTTNPERLSPQEEYLSNDWTMKATIKG